MLSFFNQCIIFGQSTAFLESLKSLKSLNEVNRELFVAQKYVSEFYNISDINIPHFIKIINLYYTNKAGVFQGLNDSVKDCMVICINDRFKLNKNYFAGVFLENSRQPYIVTLKGYYMSSQDLSIENVSFNEYFKSISEKADYERVTNGTQFKKFLYGIYHDSTVMKTRECFINYIESLIVVNNNFKYDDSNFLVTNVKGYCNAISEEVEGCKELLIKQSKVVDVVRAEISSLNQELLDAKAEISSLNKELLDTKAKISKELSAYRPYKIYNKFYISSMPSLRSEMIHDIYKNDNSYKYRIFIFDKNIIDPKSLLFKIVNNR
jgi:DNA-binding Lrp family transcriptional regulator